MTAIETAVAEINAVTAEIDQQEFKGRKIGELRRVFNAMTAGMKNWKAEINAVVHMNDLGNAIVACEFFAGSQLYDRGQFVQDGEVHFRVYAPGYYASVGA